MLGIKSILSMEGPHFHVHEWFWHRLGAHLTMDEKASLNEDRLELGHSSEPLPFFRILLLFLAQHVVKQEDERGRSCLSSLRGLWCHKLRLGFSEERCQRCIVQVTGHPDHVDGTVGELPLEVLHRGRPGVAEADILFQLPLNLLDNIRVLVEEVDPGILMGQEMLREPAVSSSDIQRSVSTMALYSREELVEDLDAVRMADLHPRLFDLVCIHSLVGQFDGM